MLSSFSMRSCELIRSLHEFAVLISLMAFFVFVFVASCLSLCGVVLLVCVHCTAARKMK